MNLTVGPTASSEYLLFGVDSERSATERQVRVQAEVSHGAMSRAIAHGVLLLDSYQDLRKRSVLVRRKTVMTPFFGATGHRMYCFCLEIKGESRFQSPLFFVREMTRHV
jgi:hypothetical protein